MTIIIMFNIITAIIIVAVFIITIICVFYFLAVAELSSSHNTGAIHPSTDGRCTMFKLGHSAGATIVHYNVACFLPRSEQGWIVGERYPLVLSVFCTGVDTDHAPARHV